MTRAGAGVDLSATIFSRLTRFACAATLLLVGCQTGTQPPEELVYGSWLPATEYPNRVALPRAFNAIAVETRGVLNWKLVSGGQLADPTTTFNAIRDGRIAGGLGVSTFVPDLLPSLNTLYNTMVFGDDVVATTGAALETLTLRCPSCIEEFKRLNAVPLSGWVPAPYYLACRMQVRTSSDVLGKRIRAVGQNAALVQQLGGAIISLTLREVADQFRQGRLDCQLGVYSWLKTFGYADYARYVSDLPLGITGLAVGLVINRDRWNRFTPEQKQIHLRQAAYISAALAIGQFVIEEEEIFNEMKRDKGVEVVHADAGSFAANIQRFEAAQRERNIAAARAAGVRDPAAILDAYAEARRKWASLSKDIGRDIDRFADTIWREIYAKVDPAQL